MLAASCVSAPELPPLEAPGTLAVPEAHRDAPLDVSTTRTLDERADELLAAAEAQALAARRFTDEELGGLVSFARIVEVFDERTGRRYRHLILVAEEAWSDENVRAVIAALYAVPAESDPPTLLHFDSDEPVPFALQYRFGNSWYARLEAALYVALTDDPGDVDGPGPYVDRSRELLSAYGLLLDNEDVDPIDELDRLLRELPRSDESLRPFDLPEATVLAIGLVLGDELQRRLPGVTWAPADESMARYYGLRVEADDQLLLRPIDFAQLAWQSQIDAPARAYTDLVSERVEAARERR